MNNTVFAKLVSQLHTNLLFVTIFSAFKKLSQVEVLNTVFAKVFDSANRKVLFSLLQASGFGDLLVS